MKIHVKYEHHPSNSLQPCLASTMVRGEPFIAFGATWEESKLQLLRDVRGWFSVKVPPPELVELDLSEDGLSKSELLVPLTGNDSEKMDGLVDHQGERNSALTQERA